MPCLDFRFRVRVKFRVRAESRVRVGLRVRAGYRVRVGLRVRALLENKRHGSGCALVKDVPIFYILTPNSRISGNGRSPTVKGRSCGAAAGGRIGKGSS